MGQENELILEAATLCLKAASLLHTAVLEADDDDDPNVKEWLEKRVGELRDLADFLDPPKPCWPANVVPFSPRRTG